MNKSELTSMLLYHKRKNDSPLRKTTVELRKQWSYRQDRLRNDVIPTIIDDGGGVDSTNIEGNDNFFEEFGAAFATSTSTCNEILVEPEYISCTFTSTCTCTSCSNKLSQQVPTSTSTGSSLKAMHFRLCC